MIYLYIYIISFILSIIIYLIIDYGLLGNNFKEKYNTHLKINYIYYIFILFIIISVVCYIIMPNTIVYFSDGEVDKVLADISNNNININNPNISLPNSMSNAVGSIGVGGAIAAGLSSGSALMKSGAPLGVKLGVTALGGAVGGALFVSMNYMNTIAQRKAGYNSGKSSSDSVFSAKSMLSNFDNNDKDLEAVLGLLNINILLHICILYLLIALAILFISNNIKLDFSFLKAIFGENIYKLITRLLIYINKTNKIWMSIIWIILLIACLGTLYISNYLSLNIDVISEIYLNSKK